MIFLMQIIYHGHSFLEIERHHEHILIDPFISQNPRCDLSLEQVLEKNISHIVLTHGHDDHVGDTIRIAQHTGAKVLAMVELCNWLESQGVSEAQLEAFNI